MAKNKKPKLTFLTPQEELILQNLKGQRMVEALASLNSIVTKTMPIENMVQMLKAAGFTRAAQTKGGSWVFLKEEDVRSFAAEQVLGEK